jgi:hypothetical protein
MKLFYIYFIVLLLISGCASTSPTIYQKLSFMSGGGYVDYKVSSDKVLQRLHPDSDVLVVVMLNVNNNLSRANDYAHRRAAELTIQNGYTFYTFIVVNSNYEESKWEGGGVSGIHLKPDVRLAIKFHNTAQDNSKKASEVIKEVTLKYEKEIVK